ncbi:MAG: cysteine desulfurase [Gemmatimonadales bacterium]|nr:cysteine desulfurase [Gemmatimonadales bacterium]MCB9518302.1 cysteine desulfurase [Gemmatimonadales bacterium]
MMDPVYLDHAATTPVRPEVIEAMLPFLRESWGNPSSSHRIGRGARAGLEQAKREVAEAVGVQPNQVIFTSGGTEADNLAIIGAALAAKAAGRPMHVVTTAIEHKASLAAAHAVCRLGGRETILPVDARGLVDLDALDAVLAEGPAVVSVMWVNNETGVVQPMAEIGARCRAAGVPLHTDAVQAFGKIPVDLEAVHASLCSLSGHKLGAPKGIGALIVRDRTLVESILHGGGQQFGIRPGTENVAGAVAMGCAAKLARAELDAHVEHLAMLRDDLARRLQAAIPDLHINAADSPRAPHVLSISVPGTDAESLLMHLDLAGICCSGGSACSTGAIEPSHVLVAMGVERPLALATLRFSLGHESTAADVERVATAFPDIVTRVRGLSAALGRA